MRDAFLGGHDEWFAGDRHRRIAELLGLPAASVWGRWSYLAEEGAPPYTEIMTIGSTPRPWPTPGARLMRLVTDDFRADPVEAGILASEDLATDEDAADEDAAAMPGLIAPGQPILRVVLPPPDDDA